MRLIPVTPPSVEPVTLAQAKLAARVDGSEEDNLITQWITAARQEIDGANGYLGRALCTQTWDVTFSNFFDGIELPLPPLQSVTSVKYLDTKGVTQTLAIDQYRIISGGHYPSKLVRKTSSIIWPDTLVAEDAVTIRMVCGYGVAADLPALIPSWILARVAGWYDQRSDVSQGTPVTDAPNICNMLSTLRVHTIDPTV